MTNLMETVRRRGGEPGQPLDCHLWERLLQQDLSSVRVHRGNDDLLAALGARAACWRDQILVGSAGTDPVTIRHELVHAAQWLKFGPREGWAAGTISDIGDPSEIEAERLASWPADVPANGVMARRSTELALYANTLRLILDCQITGHASPRWRGARNEAERIRLNDVLARQRAEAVAKYFEETLRRHLNGYSLKFRFNESFPNDDSIPDDTAVVGSLGRGQRDTIVDAKGNKSANDQKYRRTDISVRVARVLQEYLPTKVRSPWGHSTKTTWWYVGVGAGVSVDFGVGVTKLIVKLRNRWGQEAEGVIGTIGGGFGLRATGTVSLTADSSFITSREVGFEDFHGAHVRYTSAGISLGIGYSRAYLTFWGMGPDAASIFVGGPNKGIDLSANLNDGVLHLYSVPKDYIIETIEVDDWDIPSSQWVTQHSQSIYFADGSADLAPGRADLKNFAVRVAADVLSQ